MKDERLTLLAQSAADLPAFSALLQDATLRLADIAYDRRRRRLVLIVNRFRHEATTPSRVRAALRVETVTGVKRRGWPAGDDAVLPLLALALDGEALRFDFGGGAALRVEIEVPELLLEDLSAPWLTERRPDHG
jgi:hypothetical protein